MTKKTINSSNGRCLCNNIYEMQECLGYKPIMMGWQPKVCAWVCHWDYQNDGPVCLNVNTEDSKNESKSVRAKDMAQEIWAASQLLPGERIIDAVHRIESILLRKNIYMKKKYNIDVPESYDIGDPLIWIDGYNTAIEKMYTEREKLINNMTEISESSSWAHGYNHALETIKIQWRKEGMKKRVYGEDEQESYNSKEAAGRDLECDLSINEDSDVLEPSSNVDKKGIIQILSNLNIPSLFNDSNLYIHITVPYPERLNKLWEELKENGYEWESHPSKAPWRVITKDKSIIAILINLPSHPFNTDPILGEVMTSQDEYDKTIEISKDIIKRATINLVEIFERLTELKKSEYRGYSGTGTVVKGT